MRTCPYCLNISYYHFIIASRIFRRCPECDLIYQAPLNSCDEGPSASRMSYCNENSDEQMQASRSDLFNYILNLLETNQNIGTLMDVGTGCGLFLLAAQGRGWNAKGVDPSVNSVRMARDKLGLEVTKGTLQGYRKNSEFDVITFINVLDHSDMPWLEIDMAKNLLRPGGLIYLRFPNGLVHSSVYRIAFQYGLHNSVRKFLVFHKYSFTAKYIRRLLRDRGFTEITFYNSPPVLGDPYKIFPNPTISTYIKRSVHLLAHSAQVLSGGHLLFSPSLEAIAIKRADNHSY